MYHDLFISHVALPLCFSLARPQQELPPTVNNVISHEYVSPHAKRVRDTLQQVPIVVCRIIEKYAFDQWIPAAHIKDPSSFFDFMKENYLCLAYMKDKLITGTSDGHIEFYHNPKGALIQRIKAHASPLVGIAYHPATRLILTGAHDTTIKLWQGKKCIERGTLVGHRSSPKTFLLLQHARLAAGDQAGFVKTWDLAQQKEIDSKRAHGEQIMSLAQLDDNSLLSSCAFEEQTAVKLWDLSSNKLVKQLRVNHNFKNKITVIGNHRFALSQKNIILLCDTRKWGQAGESYATLKQHKKEVQCLAKLGDTLLSGSEDGMVKQWDLRRNVLLCDHYDPKEGTYMMDLIGHPDGETFAACTSDSPGTITTWTVGK